MMSDNQIMIKTQEVIDYLKQHPSFFEENQELLRYLDFGDARDKKGGAAPFYERQLKVWKDRENQQQTKIDLIVDSAKTNQRLESDLLEMAIGLLSGRQNRKDAVKTVIALVKRQFNINDVAILLNNEEGACGHPKYDDVRQRVVHQSSICDDRVSSHLLEALFNENFKAIKSCAFVPLIFSDEIKGVMVLGSTSEARFQPRIGVMFLDRLGLLAGGYFQGGK